MSIEALTIAILIVVCAFELLVIVVGRFRISEAEASAVERLEIIEEFRLKIKALQEENRRLSSVGLMMLNTFLVEVRR